MRSEKPVPFKLTPHRERTADGISEKWEVSVLSAKPSTVASGEYEGLTLAELFERKRDFFGSLSLFPILVKTITAETDLYVHVHPDDFYAAAHGLGIGKDEVWYVLDTDGDGAVYLGFKEGVSPAAIRRAVKNGGMENLLQKYSASRGDSFYIPAGTAHALLRGTTVLAVQKNSQVEYRLYNYCREGELHVDKAMRVLKSTEEENDFSTYRIHRDYMSRVLLCGGYFTCREIAVKKKYTFKLGGGFAAFTVVSGTGVLADGTVINKGETWFVPCGAECVVKTKGSNVVLVEVKV